jgi:hypothetical protein
MTFPKEGSGEPPEKPTGVTLAAALLAGFSLIAGIPILILVVSASGRRPTGWFMPVGQLLASVFLYLLATLLITTLVIAIGLLNRCRWARVGGVIFGWFLVLPAIGLAFRSRLLGFLELSVAALLGGSLAIYLSQEHVRLYFQNAEGTPQEGDAQHWTRIAVLVVAGFLLFDAWFLMGLTVVGFPLFGPVGGIYRGLLAQLAYVIGIALSLFLADGLYRRFLPAYYVALALQASNAIALLLLTVGSINRWSLAAMTFTTVSLPLALALKLVFGVPIQQSHFGLQSWVSLTASAVFLCALGFQLVEIRSRKGSPQPGAPSWRS